MNVISHTQILYIYIYTPSLNTLSLVESIYTDNCTEMQSTVKKILKNNHKEEHENNQ